MHSCSHLALSPEQVEQWRSPLYLYPNPAASAVTVHTGCGQPQELAIYAIDGRLMHRSQVTLEATLDVSHWQAGVYVIRVGSRTAKLVVGGR